ncbi:asparagine-linked glycosylation protein [Rhizoctonia solani]
MGLLESLLQILQAILCGSGKADESHGQQQQQQQQQQQASAWQQPPGAAHQYPPTHHKPSKPYHARIDDNAQAQANPHYQELRSRAREEGDAMARAFDASQEAYQSGDGAKAKELSNEGKRHKAEMERLNKEASDWIFEKVNLDSAPDELDLHGLYVKEAIERTEAAVEAAQSRGDEQIRIIVGKGLHSQGHIAKLKPAIEELMVKYRLNAHIDPENTGVLVVQLGGHSQRGMDPNEVTRRLERDDEQSVFASYLALRAHARHVHKKGIAQKRRLTVNRNGGSIVVGFFHPYCNSGGGGERVLWASIAYLQRTNNQVLSVVYTGDTDATKEEIITKVKTRFDIILDPSSLEFVFLRERWVIEDTTWPRFTLIGQSLGSMMLAYEAMCGLIPDLFIDTMGYAFTFHVVRWFSGGKTPISAYVHYPTISTDMLARVKSRTAQYNNPSDIAKSEFRTNSKLLYYNMFALAYSASLSLAQPIMVNSSWTKNHVEYLLTHSPVPSESSKNLSIVYPPCDTQAMASFSLEGRKKIIMSLAQFRPEKDHAKQIIALAKLFEAHPEHKEQGVRLVLIGSSRNTADEYRVVALQDLVNKLNLDGSVEFIINASYDVVLSWLAGASIGTNTMVDEHFGINVVEFMAAGLIPVVHASGGPLNDIVVPYQNQPTGTPLFLDGLSAVNQ